MFWYEDEHRASMPARADVRLELWTSLVRNGLKGLITAFCMACLAVVAVA